MPGLGLSPQGVSNGRYLKQGSENIVLQLVKAIYSYVNSFGRLRMIKGSRLLALGAGLWMMGVHPMLLKKRSRAESQ